MNPVLHARTEGMVRLAGGAFTMGSDRHYPEEAPASRAEVGAFWIDTHPVTNAQFEAFVAETGYVTTAEVPPSLEDYPDLDPSARVAGSLLFKAPAVPARDWRQWWCFEPGACWRYPQGPGSQAQADHPVVHVSYLDAQAYAAWCGKSLPTEAEWEFAARGGLEGAEYAWGDTLDPQGRLMANYWQGQFPHENLLLDGFLMTSPIGTFPANGYGLYDMIGNVWEWTCAPFTPDHRRPASCCGGAQAHAPAAPAPRARETQHVLKGGSFLCASNYCARYRPAARSAQSLDSSSCHIGFRCVMRD